MLKQIENKRIEEVKSVKQHRDRKTSRLKARENQIYKQAYSTRKDSLYIEPKVVSISSFYMIFSLQKKVDRNQYFVERI
jgi:hypothetical protein